ncbi:Transcription initiation factor TFIID subunit 5 [Schistosoma japonicum]|nr:Transcription initiation factor TFIID subunit 5 [Schistosoma japonicum]
MTSNEEILSVLKILQKYNLKESELALKQEAGLVDEKIAEEFLKFKAQIKDEPEHFCTNYQSVLTFMDSVPDIHKVELSTLLFPIFVHMHLRLVSGNISGEAKKFLTTFRKYQEDFYQSDINMLSNITSSQHLSMNPLVESFRASEFVVSVSAESYSLLRHFLQEKEMPVIQSILKEQLSLEIVNGPPRSKLQIDCRRGALFGEARFDANKEPVLYGLLRDPSLDLSVEMDADLGVSDVEPNNTENVEDNGDQNVVKKKKRRDGMVSGSGHSGRPISTDLNKSDSNSPALDRIPLPKLRESYIESKQALSREISTLLRNYQQRNPQKSSMGTSTVLYTICNAQAGESTLAIRRGGVTCCSFSDDSSQLAAGFGSGRIRVWSLGPESLRRMLPASELSLLDEDDSRVKTNMLYDENDETHLTRDLLGHLGSVFSVSFSPDRQLIASASSDGTVRLWSTLIWGGALTAWRDHLLPVWCVTWAPTYGHYIATGGADRSAHLYATDHAPDALRVFVGHKGDVTSVCIHPNVNYLATGSADRAVRLFDVRSGKLTRIYTGHKGSVQSLAFSPCGRYLASGGWCGTTCLWDLGSGQQVGQLGGYSASRTSVNQSNGDLDSQEANSDSSQWLTGPVVSLAFCPGNSGRLATGGLEGALRIWNTVNGWSTAVTNSATGNTDSKSKTNLVALHRLTKQQFVRQNGKNSKSGGVGSHNILGYYSPAIGPDVSDACASEVFYTRRTSLLGLHYVHPYLLLAAGPYNQT